MKHFFALPALLRSAAILAAASQHTFSVGDDILAFPQFEVRFDDEWISEPDSQSKLLSDDKTRVQRASQDDTHQGAPTSQVGQYTPRQPGDAYTNGDDSRDVRYEYMMTNDGQRWLCGLPTIAPPEDMTGVNETQSKADEENELARATTRGWELLSGMQGNCVFFISGWWSYRFCYNQGVKQFHQLPPSRGIPVYPPMEDPSVPPFMLGTYEKRIEDDGPVKEEKWEGESALDMSEGARRRRSSLGELVQKGETRYLVQRLGGGTVCDLTGKERRIEVQFHCNPQTADRISLIQETRACAYLMVIQTPRLCNDVAFLPPQKDQPNPVSCRPILADDEVESYEQNLKALRAAEKEAKIWEASAEAAAIMEGEDYEAPPQLVGDIIVGGRAIVPDGVYIAKSAIVGGGQGTYVDTVASSDGKALSKDDLEKLGLGDTKAIEKLKKELENIAKGQDWKLDVVDTPQGREYRGIVGEDAQAQDKSGTKSKKKTSERKDEEEDDEKGTRGSEEEFYHEEL